MSAATTRLATPRLTREVIAELSTLRSRSFLRMLATDWAVVLAAGAMFLRWSNLYALIPAVILIGGRQHAFFILMHDATHYRALGNRRLADRVTNLLLAWPMGYSVEDYRTTHFAHHRSTNTEEDPDFLRRMGNVDWKFPMARGRFYGLFLRDLCGVSLLSEWLNAAWTRARRLVVSPPRLSTVRPSPRQLMLAAVILVTIPFGVTGKVLLLWYLPMLTWTEAIVRFRNVSEHFSLPQRELLHPTRTLVVSRPTSVLLGLRNANYHVEHHLYPSVPLTRLPELRARLLAEPGYAERTHTTHGVRALLRECVA